MDPVQIVVCNVGQPRIQILRRQGSAPGCASDSNDYRLGDRRRLAPAVPVASPRKTSTSPKEEDALGVRSIKNRRLNLEYQAKFPLDSQHRADNFVVRPDVKVN
jgi:hypothetical protein